MFSRQWRSYSTAISPSVQEIGDQLRRCALSKSLKQGKEIHVRIVASKHESTFLGNLLVQMYGSCSDIQSAAFAFSKIKRRNIFSWNILITAFTQNRQPLPARRLFDRMPYRDPVSWNVIITCYAQQGSLHQARAMFDQTPDHDIVTWNAMIAAYAQNGFSLQALELFKLMQIEGVRNDRITFTSAIDACADCLPAVALGRIIHAEIETCGIVVDRKIYNSLINMYCKAGLLIDAKIVFDAMADRDIVSWTALMMSFSHNGQLRSSRAVFDRMPQRDTTAWNVLIMDMARRGDLSSAMELFRSVPEQNSVSSTTMMAAFSQNGNLLLAKEVFDHLPHAADVVAWNAVIAAHVQHGSFPMAVKLFQEMILCGVTPNRITFISSLHACARVAVLGVGKAIHEEIKLQSLQSDVTLITMLISMYGRCSRVTEARCLFDDDARIGDRAKNVLLWNTILAAYAQNGRVEESLQLLCEMNQAGAAADQVTFIVVLSACSHAGLLRDARREFLSMVGDHGLVAAKDHFGCMIDLMGRVGQLEKAEDLIVSMPFEPDIVTWTTLVGACRVHRDHKRGLRISKLALASDPRSSSPYALLSNLFATESSAADREDRLDSDSDMNRLPFLGLGVESSSYLRSDASEDQSIRLFRAAMIDRTAEEASSGVK